MTQERIKEKIVMKDRLTPEIKTVATQLPVNNIDCQGLVDQSIK